MTTSIISEANQKVKKKNQQIYIYILRDKERMIYKETKPINLTYGQTFVIIE